MRFLVLLLLLGLIGWVVFSGVFYDKSLTIDEIKNVENKSSGTEQIDNTKKITPKENTSETVQAEGTTPSKETIHPTDDVIVDIGKLTDGQKAIASKLGINVDTLVITPKMTACAEEAVGKERLDEITTGATPGLLEGVKLLGCYKNR